MGCVDRNSDNRANSAQFQVKLPTGASESKIDFTLSSKIQDFFSHLISNSCNI